MWLIRLEDWVATLRRKGILQPKVVMEEYEQKGEGRRGGGGG